MGLQDWNSMNQSIDLSQNLPSFMSYSLLTDKWVAHAEYDFLNVLLHLESFFAISRITEPILWINFAHFFD